MGGNKPGPALDIVADPGPGQGLSQQQCDAAKSEASLTVTVSPNHAKLLFIYGPSPAKLKAVVDHIDIG